MCTAADSTVPQDMRMMMCAGLAAHALLSCLVATAKQCGLLSGFPHMHARTMKLTHLLCHLLPMLLLLPSLLRLPLLLFCTGAFS
jgi:hypothetical protein